MLSQQTARQQATLIQTTASVAKELAKETRSYDIGNRLAELERLFKNPGLEMINDYKKYGSSSRNKNQLIDSSTSIGEYNILLSLLALFQHSKLTAHEIMRAYPSMIKALNNLLTIPNFSNHRVTASQASYFNVTPSTTLNELRATIPVLEEIDTALKEQESQYEISQKAESARREYESNIREIGTFGGIAGQVPSLFAKFEKIENLETKTELKAKLMATFLLSLDKADSINQNNFHQAYKANTGGMLGMFKSDFSKKYPGRNVADVILEKYSDPEVATSKAFNSMLNDSGIIYLQGCNQDKLREEITLLRNSNTNTVVAGRK